MPPIIDSVLRAGEGRILRKLKRISEQINSIEDDFVAMSDAEQRAMTDEFRQRYADGETLDELLPEAFAVPTCHRRRDGPPNRVARGRGRSVAGVQGPAGAKSRTSRRIIGALTRERSLE